MKNENTKHTPGPWEWFREDNQFIVETCDSSPEPHTICEIGEDCVPMDPEVKKRERADACLIAAAPELLAALENMVNDGWENDEVRKAKARAAIAKAKGEE